MNHRTRDQAVMLVAVLSLAGCMPTASVMIERITPPAADVSGIREIAVLPFSASGSHSPYAAHAEERLISVLARTGRYRVMKGGEARRILEKENVRFSYPPDAALVRRTGSALGVDAVIYGDVEGFDFEEESRLVKVTEKVWSGDYERDSHGIPLSDKGEDGRVAPRKIYRERIVEKNQLKRYAELRIHYRMADIFHGNVICAESESESGSWEGTGAVEIAKMPGREVIFDLLLDRATKNFVRNIAPHPIEEERLLELGTSPVTKLGVDLAKNNLWDEAVEKWIQASKTMPDETAAFYNLGIAFERKGLFDLAYKSYQNALARRPGSKRYIKAIAHIQKLMKDLQ